MGFCFYNNIALAAAHAIVRRGLERVVIVDWDVHHGNGTQAALYERRDVLVFGSHQHPLYPGTGGASEAGRGDGEGYTVNCPLPAGCGDGLHCGLHEQVLTPLVERFKPEFILATGWFLWLHEDWTLRIDLRQGMFQKASSGVTTLVSSGIKDRTGRSRKPHQSGRQKT